MKKVVKFGGQADNDVQKENDNKVNENEKGASMRKKAPWERRRAA